MEQNEEEQKEEEVKEVEKLGRLQFKLDYDFNSTNVSETETWDNSIVIDFISFDATAGRHCDPG